ncbi:AbrB family transcriptional regulator [Bacillaceae bacterium]
MEKTGCTTRRNSVRILETALVALGGGFFFTRLHVPLSWLLGPMTAVIVYQNLTGRALAWHPSLRNSGLLILGLVLGSSFHREAVNEIIPHVPYMFLTTLLLVAFAFLMGSWMGKRTGLNQGTGLYASVPGGLSQMVALSQETEGVDETAVAFIQTIRVISVIFLVPFVTVHGASWFGWEGAGTSSVEPPAAASSAAAADGWMLAPFFLLGWGSAVLAARVKLPTSYLLGPLFLTAALNLLGVPLPSVPKPALVLSQLLIGTSIGLSMKLSKLPKLNVLLGYTFATSALLILFSFALGFLLSSLTAVDIPTAILATAPGGVAEMGLTAVIVNADLSIVSSYQLFRVFVMVAIMPFVLQWWMERKGKKRVCRHNGQGVSSR